MAVRNFKGQEIKTEVNTGFKPLPMGRYEATIFGVKNGKYENKAKKKSYGLANKNIQFRISDGQAGANRRVFLLNPDEPNWNDGSDAFMFHQFWSVVMGMEEADFRKKLSEGEDIDFPEDEDLLGFPVTLLLKVEDDTYAFEKAKEKNPEAKQSDHQRNAIQRILPEGNGNAPVSGSSEADPPRPKATVLDL